MGINVTKKAELSRLAVAVLANGTWILVWQGVHSLSVGNGHACPFWHWPALTIDLLPAGPITTSLHIWVELAFHQAMNELFIMQLRMFKASQ